MGLSIPSTASVIFLLAALSGTQVIAQTTVERQTALEQSDNHDPDVSACFRSAGFMAVIDVIAGMRKNLEKKEFDEALSKCSKVVAGEHSNVWKGGANINVGKTYLAMGDPKKSIEYLTKGIALTPNISGAFSSRGDAYKKLDNLDQAISDYKTAACLDKVYNGAFEYEKLGIIYNDLAEYDFSIAYFNKAIEALAGDVNSSSSAMAMLYKKRGVVWSNKGDSAKAQADYARSIELETKSK